MRSLRAVAFTLVALAGCRGVLGIEDRPELQPVTEGGTPSLDGAPLPRPDGNGSDAPADTGSDGAVSDALPDVDTDREVDLAWPAWPLPALSPPTASYSVTQGTVIDMVTGLQWEGAPPATPLVWEDAFNRCETLLLAGASDWRMPYRSELASLVDYTRHDPAINPVVFPGTLSTWTWSQSSWAANPDTQKWMVSFGNGQAVWDGIHVEHAVRCVRGPSQAAKPPARYAVRGGEVTDKETHLVWEATPVGQRYSRIDALTYCQGLKLNGHTGFRVPNVRELMSLIDEREVQGPVWDKRVFDFPAGMGMILWSTTAQTAAPPKVFVIHFGFNGSTYDAVDADMLSVRCVR